jgi:hypothetical protein
MEARLLHADGRTDRHDETNSLFPIFCKRGKKVKNQIAAVLEYAPNFSMRK